MDALPRSRRLLLKVAPLVCLTALAAGACGGPKKDGLVGVSTSAPSAQPRTRDAGVVAADAGIPADWETSFAKVSAVRFTSNGHASGRWDVDVLANEAGKDVTATGVGVVPVGAKIIEVHWERADGARGPLMMMEKREKGFDPDHGDWRYVVLTKTGEVVKDGAIESCASCHDDAPHDHLFKVGP